MTDFDRIHPTHFRVGGTDAWLPMPETADLEGWIARRLMGMQHQDSDGGYTEHIEFALPDRTRLYAAAEYCGGGAIESLVFGTEEYVKERIGEYAVDRQAFGPERDWLLLPGTRPGQEVADPASAPAPAGPAEGFYWVRLPCAEGRPVVANRLSGRWLFAGYDEPIPDHLVEVLGGPLTFGSEV